MPVELLDKILLVSLLAVTFPLIIIILIQHGKGADMGAAFGSGSANTLFGNTGSSGFLVKLTTFLAVAFFLITFGLAHVASQKASGTLGIGVPDDAIENVPAAIAPEITEAILGGMVSDIPENDSAVSPAPASTSDVPTIDP